MFCLNVVSYSNFIILCNWISWDIETGCVFIWRQKTVLHKGCVARAVTSLGSYKPCPCSVLREAAFAGTKIPCAWPRTCWQFVLLSLVFYKPAVMSMLQRSYFFQQAFSNHERLLMLTAKLASLALSSRKCSSYMVVLQ